MSLSLPALFARSLATASKALNLPATQDESQDLVRSSLIDLKDLRGRIIELSLFSPNETLEDITTRDLVYLFLPFVLAEVNNRARTLDRRERMASLTKGKEFLNSFISTLCVYEIIPEDEQKLYGRKTPPKAVDAAKRRQLKIEQYQKEKDLKARLETLRRRRSQAPVSGKLSSDLDFIASLLPSISDVKDNGEELDSETEEILRETTLLFLRVIYAQVNSQLESLDQELVLLSNAPPEPTQATSSRDANEKMRESEANLWKLDMAIPSSSGPDGKGPLLDSSGKPLRPFTILPSDAGQRARLQAQVFGPGHNLPTMSIDQYLEIERERGNILTGGGPAGQSELTTSAQLALNAEMDGTREGEEREEQKRQKEENWARFTDENPKGAGNTMNRG